MNNLPPGCTDYDIDRSAGITEKDSCRDCDEVFTVNELNEDNRCDECEEKFDAKRHKQNENREAFEAWVGSPPNERSIEKFTGGYKLKGNYVDPAVELAWLSWEESQSL